LMFGSNFPVDSLYSSFSKLYLEISQLIPEQFHGRIFAENCRKFYQF
ncbi:MAG: amidohydrolase, partial [Rhodobacterales bacterium]|nr:amidohydrolase [Rhodobacterales bacterium]